MRGFILQPTYRIESGRPVVHLYGRLESGDPFLVRDDTQVPHFFVRTSDAARAAKLGAQRIHATELKTLAGEPLSRVEIALPPEAPLLREKLTAAGVPTYEADVRFAMRFLIDRGIRGAMEIEPLATVDPGASGADTLDPAKGVSIMPGAPGAGAMGHGHAASQAHATPSHVNPSDHASASDTSPTAGSSAHNAASSVPRPLRVYDRPLLTPIEWTPALKVLSLDIETDMRGRRAYAISLHTEGPTTHSEVLYVPPSVLHPGPHGEPATIPEGPLDVDGVRFTATPLRNERSLIEAFCERVAAIDPDVLTGWNVIDFDLRVLERIARRGGTTLRLGRTPEPLKLRTDDSFMRAARAEIAGRVVLDGIDLIRGAFVKLEDYSLETTSRTLLGEGKLIGTRHRAEEIERLYRHDLPRFLAYNYTDSRLVTDILKKAGLLDLAIRRSLLTGMPLDRVGASIASFDSLYLHELRARGHAAPSVGAITTMEPTAGGAVLEPVIGLHENVLVFDYKSLYPSLMRTFNIDPISHVPNPTVREIDSGELIRAPNGAFFRRQPAILPGLLDRLVAERAAARARGDAIASQALKILMNSFYGVLATPACRMHNPAVANAITHFGQATLMWTRDRAEELGYRVLYGDTDSLFVAAGTPDPGEARHRGEALAAALNRDMQAHIEATWSVRSRLELEFQRLYRRLFLPSVRHGTLGARKRYAGLVEEGGRREVVFTGMEIVRRDWTELAKIFQRGLFERLFNDEELGPFIVEFVAALRAGAHDDRLVYRKALRKGIAEYTATTPPHVKAARMMGERAGRIIEYVMTVNGPEPAAKREGSFDYEHYVEKQVRPVAETVLTHLGASFDTILGRETTDTTQMDLF